MLKKSLALASLTLLLAAPLAQMSGLSASANTHTWHKGTPKVLRGEWTWIKKDYDYAGGGGQVAGFVFTKSGFTYGEQGEPMSYTKHAKYRSLGHGVYKIHAYDYIEARKTQGVWETYMIKKGHHKLRIKLLAKYGKYMTYHRGKGHFPAPKR